MKGATGVSLKLDHGFIVGGRLGKPSVKTLSEKIYKSKIIIG